ncbi:MAG: SurA N-terminal domain-containing protein [Pseudomonadota bacterium]
MLDFLRRGVKSWVAKALLALLILSFAVWGIGGEIFSFSMRTAVARVGDTKITAEQFVNAYTREQNVLSQQQGELVTHDRMRALRIDDAVMQDLIRRAAFNEELVGFGVRVSDDAAMEAIRSRPDLQAGGQFSVQAMQLAMGRQGLSDVEFVDMHRNLVGRNLLSSPAVAATRSPPGLAARIAAYQNETKQIAVVTLPLALAGEPGLPDEGAIRAEYEENPQRYTEPERRYGTYLHVDIADLVTRNQPEEALLREIYQDEIERFQQPASRQLDQLSMPDMASAEEAVGRLRSGLITFEALAEERGQTLADLDLGTVSPGELPAATDGPVFAATEPGILDPVDLPVGAAILRIREVVEATTLPFEEVRDALADRTARDLAFEAAPGLANQIEELRAGGSTFEEIAAATGLSLAQLDGLGTDGTKAGGAAVDAVLRDPLVSREIFEALDGEERPIIETSEGGFFTVMLERIEPAGLQPLEAVRDRVVADWEISQKLAELETRAAKTAELVSGDGSLQALAPALGLTVDEPAPFTRLDPPAWAPDPLVARIFASETGTGLSTMRPDRSGVMVIEVTASIEMPADVTAEAAAQIDTLVEQTVRADELELFTRAIVARHETSTDPDALDQVFTRLTGQRPDTY